MALRYKGSYKYFAASFDGVRTDMGLWDRPLQEYC